MATTIIKSPRFFTTWDVDARNYISAVELADGQDLEMNVKFAINDFVVGCKADNIWNAIKASCILAGARTLAGALVPLKGSAPTNFNFVSDDYNRKTGLKGNGSTKYLDTNRNATTDPQNDCHLGVNITQQSTGLRNDAGGYYPYDIYRSGSLYYWRIKGNTSISVSGIDGMTGFSCGVRTSSTHVNAVYGSLSTSSVSNNSTTITSGNVLIFARNSAEGAIGHSNASLSFYTLGESLNAFLYESRVKKLMTNINNAI